MTIVVFTQTVITIIMVRVVKVMTAKMATANKREASELIFMKVKRKVNPQTYHEHIKTQKESRYSHTQIYEKKIFNGSMLSNFDL